MLLTCDIGNTNIKSGLFLEDKLTEFNIFPSCLSFIEYYNSKKIKQTAFSSVVPERLEEIKNYLIDKSQIFEVNKTSSFNLKINYDSPDTLGIDRICSCEGAFYLFRNSNQFQNYDDETFILTMDFGTASTINIVKHPGEFIGGVIAPGFHIMSDVLNNKTAQLPGTELSDYKKLIGRTTKQSIASGILNSTLGLIDRTIIYLRKEYTARKIYLFITGGNADLIIPFLNFELIHEKALVLYGIKSIYDNRYEGVKNEG